MQEGSTSKGGDGIIQHAQVSPSVHGAGFGEGIHDFGQARPQLLAGLLFKRGQGRTGSLLHTFVPIQDAPQQLLHAATPAHNISNPGRQY